VHGAFGADRRRRRELHEVPGLFRQGSGISGSLTQAIDGGHETGVSLADRLVIFRRRRFAGHGQPLSNGRTRGLAILPYRVRFGEHAGSKEPGTRAERPAFPAMLAAEVGSGSGAA